MTYAAESGYEFFGDIEIRIFQETADPSDIPVLPILLLAE